jgi:ribosomal protein S18 acetylase RimI-like enzyme
MTKFVKDNFITNLLGYQAYILNGYKQSFLIKEFKKLKKPYFLTIKSRTKISKRIQKKFRISFGSKLIEFKKKFKLQQLSIYKCRLACRKDLIQIKKISLEKSSNSRFSKDKLLPKKFRKYYRYFWLNNFFKKKRGDYLIVCEYKKNILGFILLLKKMYHYRIDLIVVKNDKQSKGVGNSLINYVNQHFLRTGFKLVAGTQSDNNKAISFYKKNGFIKLKDTTYNYHIHS